jgi:hypothetical protein
MRVLIHRSTYWQDAGTERHLIGGEIIEVPIKVANDWVSRGIASPAPEAKVLAGAPENKAQRARRAE